MRVVFAYGALVCGRDYSGVHFVGVQALQVVVRIVAPRRRPAGFPAGVSTVGGIGDETSVNSANGSLFSRRRWGEADDGSFYFVGLPPILRRTFRGSTPRARRATDP